MGIISSSLATGAFIVLARADPLELRLSEGYLTLTLDGQALPLKASSGTSRSFVFYGPEYERMYGRGSCEKQYHGCYFCLEDDPCEGISSRKKWSVRFEDGTYQYVEHDVTLGIGEHILRNFTFGLVIHFPTPYVRDPMAILGLSFGRPHIPEAFLEQLKRKGVITTLSYSVHVNERGPGISGDLMLHVPYEMRSSPFVVFNERLASRKIATSMGPVELFVPGEVKSTHSSKRGVPVLLDMGSESLLVEKKVFHKIIKKTIKSMKNSKPGLRKSRKELACESSKWNATDDDSVVKESVVPYLPVVAFTIGESPETVNIRIEPKHYVNFCDDACCKLGIAPVDDSLGPAVLGHPLFRAYDVKFDLEGERVYFSRGARQTTSLTGAETIVIETHAN